ncbi:MAG TPA: class I SAM-dependent methyltransferase, partial [Xanthobacteraceae bacterium]|nr:class I SAM-dependent methyltransferase [Xanthobacteraceae bacterium]
MKLANCKICGFEAPFVGVVDFNRSCMAEYNAKYPPVGVPIYYQKCSNCDFTFTTAFDDWSAGRFAEEIYNERYIECDPDYADARPRSMSEDLSAIFDQFKGRSVLDYGCGSGRMMEIMRELGFRNLDGYDPISYCERPKSRYELAYSVEVIEHSPTPWETFREAVSYLSKDAVFAFTTLVVDHTIAPYDLSNWYVAPRNGHVSLYSRAALLLVASELGYDLWTNGNFHVFVPKGNPNNVSLPTDLRIPSNYLASSSRNVHF